MSAKPYMDPTTDEWVGEYETRNPDDGEVSRRTQWFATEQQAKHFARTGAITLDKEEADLLRSYDNGPRIWDAASVFKVVLRLADRGLVAPDGDSCRYALTAAGRALLDSGGRA